MPKLKSNRGAAKRFKADRARHFKRSHSHANHILTKKSPKRKRNLRDPALVSASDRAAIAKLLPYR